ncbi:hypothetical protein OS493_000541 [Desmophyllum pertusum]|uniref:Uncharacterized protein n=1 Tax=Desmophyllum pertusum TaxID=174260 RepID=A0A9X0A831_9CNID|nr:hypothetical protein OS493_000541 [Desmophyllum pertusum]
MAALRYDNYVLRMFNDSISEGVERRLQRPLQPDRPFVNLDEKVPHPVSLPDKAWVELFSDTKDEFEVDGAGLVMSTWRAEEEGRVLDAQMTDERPASLLRELPEDKFLLRIKFLKDLAGEFVIEGKSVPVREVQNRGQQMRETRMGVLTGIDHVYYQNAYPVTAVIKGFTP